MRCLADSEPILVLGILLVMVELTHLYRFIDAWFYGLLLLGLAAAAVMRRGATSLVGETPGTVSQPTVPQPTVPQRTVPQRSKQQRSKQLRSAPLWEDLLLLISGVGMIASTLLSAEPKLFPLFVWSSGLFLAIYAHHRFGRGFGFGILVLAGALIVALNLWAGSFQLLSPSPRVTEMVGGGGVRMTRAVGLFWTANILGSWLILFLPLLLLSGLERLRHRRFGSAVTYGFLVLGSLFLLLRNLSRLSILASFLVLTLCLFVFGLRHLRHPRRTYLIVALLLMVVASVSSVLWLAHSDTQADHRYSKIVQAKIRDSSDTIRFRLSLQERALEKIPEHLFLGLGYEGSSQIMPSVGEVVEDLSPSLEQRYRAALDRSYTPHHMGLMLALDAGLISCLCFFAAIGLTFLRYAKKGLAWGLDTHALAISVLGWLFLGLGYNVVYGREVWPLGLFLLGAFRGALRRESPPGLDP